MNATTGVETGLPVDGDALRREVGNKCRAVAIEPHGDYHFHTGGKLAARLGYDTEIVAALPDAAVESFAGGAGGEKNAGRFEVYGYPFLAGKPVS